VSLARWWWRISDTMQLLIEHGADVNARDGSQSTPLHLASSEKEADPLLMSIPAGLGVDVNAQDERTDENPRRNAEIAQLLIEYGADVNARDGSQSTPLHLASSSPTWWNAKTVVLLLIKHGAGVNAYDGNHMTPLHRLASSWSPNVDSLRLLLENGADLDVEDDEGLTPFQIASKYGRHESEIAQLLSDRRPSASVVSNRT
jgi:ankyrin repeat protein